MIENLYVLVVNDLLTSDRKLTSWESDFLVSLDMQMLRGKQLSAKQKLFVDKICSNSLKPPKRKHSSKSKHKKNKIVEGVSIRGMTQPPEGTVFYSGTAPPW